MPRKARIDAPGAIHHVICRGLERREIFWDDPDRDSFVIRLGDVIKQTSTRCFAWVLIPNHFHLLLQTGVVPIATVMRRLLTGYAVVFNRRHNRVGHVFQNRYKSILCQAEPYLLELVRYIHLNPLRAGIVTSMTQLGTYRYSGHCQILGTGTEPWQTTEDVLLRFGDSTMEAREKYTAFVAEGIEVGKRPELTGGGLVRSAGGWQSLLTAQRAGVFLKSDERILGDSDFVEAVLGAAEEQIEKKTVWEREGYGLEQAAQRAAELLHMNVEEVLLHRKKPTTVEARSLLCFFATREMGISATAVALSLGLSLSAVTRGTCRGERIVAERGWQLK